MNSLHASYSPEPVHQHLGTGHVLVIDCAAQIAALSDALVGHGRTSTFTRQPEHALRVLHELRPEQVLLAVDHSYSNPITESELIKAAVALGAHVVVLGPEPDSEWACKALAQGAAAYLPDNADAVDVWAALQAQPQRAAGAVKKVHLSKSENPVFRFGELVSQCPKMRQVVEQIRRVAPTSASVLISGESGTGKEVAARAIHHQSQRRNQPFIAINCGAISAQLIESELFGHEKGSFTGAIKEHKGVFERAHGGTLLLDEITEMPLALQVKLLRVLETQCFTRLGSDREQYADVRILAATNRCPEKEVEAKRFRADLLYRIQVFPIWLPPLRDRSGDVKLLAEYFLGELNQKEGSNKYFSPEALEVLSQYHWPGNLRELKNLVQRTCIMTEHSITVDDLLPHIQNSNAPVRQRGSSLTVNIGTSVAEMEKNLIMATLDQCGGRKEKAAGILGVSVKTLYNRLREYQERVLSDGPESGQ